MTEAYKAAERRYHAQCANAVELCELGVWDERTRQAALREAYVTFALALEFLVGEA